MEITTKDYSVKYDVETVTVHWEGFMRLNSNEFEPIERLLDQVATLESPRLTYKNFKPLIVQALPCQGSLC